MSEKREFPRRKTGERNPKLIIIAAEGTKTEKSYFENLAIAYENKKTHVEVIDRLENQSDPQHILKQLNHFKSFYKLRKDDELWLVIDVDRWRDAILADIARQCIQKVIKLAVSNPCFEIWMLLHHRGLDDYSIDEIQEFRLNRKDGTNRTRLERELIKILNRYNKTDPHPDDFIPHVDVAIKRSRAIDINQNERWPSDIGTRVYLLAMSIIQK